MGKHERQVKTGKTGSEKIKDDLGAWELYMQATNPTRVRKEKPKPSPKKVKKNKEDEDEKSDYPVSSTLPHELRTNLKNQDSEERV